MLMNDLLECILSKQNKRVENDVFEFRLQTSMKKSRRHQYEENKLRKYWTIGLSRGLGLGFLKSAVARTSRQISFRPTAAYNSTHNDVLTPSIISNTW